MHSGLLDGQPHRHRPFSVRGRTHRWQQPLPPRFVGWRANIRRVVRLGWMKLDQGWQPLKPNGTHRKWLILSGFLHFACRFIESREAFPVRVRSPLLAPTQILVSLRSCVTPRQGMPESMPTTAHEPHFTQHQPRWRDALSAYECLMARDCESSNVV